MGETQGFFHADIRGTGLPVMPEGDVTEFPCDAPPNDIKGQSLIIDHYIIDPIDAHIQMEGCCILILPEEGHEVMAIHPGVLGEPGKGDYLDPRIPQKDGQGINGRFGDVVLDQDLQCFCGGFFIVWLHGFTP